MTDGVETEEFADLEKMVLDGIMADESRAEVRVQAAAEDAVTLRRAARTVWHHQCNRHGCTEGPDCTHPNHRRDVHRLRFHLEILGIALAPDDDWDRWFRELYTAS